MNSIDHLAVECEGAELRRRSTLSIVGFYWGLFTHENISFDNFKIRSNSIWNLSSHATPKCNTSSPPPAIDYEIIYHLTLLEWQSVLTFVKSSPNVNCVLITRMIKWNTSFTKHFCQMNSMIFLLIHSERLWRSRLYHWWTYHYNNAFIQISICYSIWM